MASQLLGVQMIPLLRWSQGEEGTSEPGSNDLDGGGDDNSDGQDGRNLAVKVSCY